MLYLLISIQKLDSELRKCSKEVYLETKLQKYFPVIRNREEILKEINENEKLRCKFYKWKAEEQTEFLNYCSGMKGLKILYDSYFKEIFNPENTPERLEGFLSAVIGEKIKILRVLPNDTVRLADEESLLVTDIIVELENGTLANIEVQKVGYAFPGQRAACYGADLLLRQYKRIRGEKNKKFSYKDVKTVYTIVFFEKSEKEFHKFSDTYVHMFEQKSNTGLNLDLLEKFIFIPLDIFKKVIHNKKEKNELDYWLLFLCSEKPDEIIELIENYPKFKALYQHIYDMCQNVEVMMRLFSRELEIMDRNTTRIMIDQMSETIERQEEENTKLTEEKNQLTEEKNQLIEEKNQLIGEKNQLKKESEKFIQELREKDELIWKLLSEKENE